MAEAVHYRDGIGRKDLQKIRRRFAGIHRERLHRIESELRPPQRVFLGLLPLLFHINHPTLPGFVGTTTPAGIPDFTPGQNLLRMAKKLSRSFDYKKRAKRRFHVHGLYLMGSIGSIAHTAGSDFDVWLCHNPELSPRMLRALRSKSDRIEKWAKDLGLEVHVFLMNTEAFRRGELDTLSHESSGSTQPRLLLEEFYRTGVLLAGRYPLWWLVPPEEESNYTAYAAMLLRKRFVDRLDCIDFGGLEELPADEFFGAAHWQLFKGIGSPYKTILKLLLNEAYAEDYPQVQWLCQEAKAAIYAGCTDVTELDPYVLMYRRVEQYLYKRNETKRLELARRCFYFKAETPLSRNSRGHWDRWQNLLLQSLTEEWHWEQRDLIIMDSREDWKIDRVLSERNTLVRELTHSYRLLTDFARTHAHSGQINSEELNLLGRKLYTALEKRPGKIDSINPGISKSLVEHRVSLHYTAIQGEDYGWFLFLGEVNEEQALVSSPIKATPGLIEMLTWCHLNRVIDRSTVVGIYPEGCRVRPGELHSLFYALRNIYPEGADIDTPIENLANQPYALSCTLFINTGIDPMAHLSKQGKQLTSDRSDPLSFGAAHTSLVENIEQLITTSWGETLVLSHQETSGLLNCLCHYLRLALVAKAETSAPKVSAHSYSSVRSRAIARRVEKLFNDACAAFGPEGSGLDSRYLLQADDEYYLIQRKQEGFYFMAMDSQEELLDLLGDPLHSFRAVVIDDLAFRDTPFPAIFTINRPGIIQVFYHSEKHHTQLYLLDEQGSLFRQQVQSTDEHYLLIQLQRFLDGIRLLRSLQAEEPAHRLLLDAPEFYRLTRNRDGRYLAESRTPPRHGLPDSYLELRLVSEGLDLSLSPHLFVCGEREFSSLQYGDQLFAAVAAYILAQRDSQKSYPIYITGLDLSDTSGEGSCSTIDLFNLKKRLERKLNRALSALLRA